MKNSFLFTLRNNNKISHLISFYNLLLLNVLHIHHSSLKYLSLLIVLTLTSCLETSVNYDLPFTETPLAIGFIDSVNGARVFVGKNANILTKDSNIVKDAQVSLWSEDGWVENLTFLNKNIFISSPNFKVLTNKNYYFKATTPLSKDSLISEKITLPKVVPIENVRYRYTNFQQNQINLYVDIKDTEGFNAYTFQIQRYKKDTLFDTEIVQNPLFIPKNGQIFSDRAFQGQPYTFVIENINVEQYIDKRSIQMDNLKITLFSISKPMYDLFLSLNTSEPTVGDPFFEPNVISNQVKNGLGILGAYSSFTYVLKL